MLMTESYPAGALSHSASSTTPCDTDPEPCSERLRLKIQPQPPKFPFRDHPFDITVYLVDPSDHLKSGVTIPLNVELYSAEKMVPVEKQIMHIDPSTKPVMSGDGICKLRLRITECSMALGNRKFVVHISAAKSGSNDYMIVPAVTSEMIVIQHRLMIQENLPELWYKDEGGRDKCMTLPIFLVNEKGDRVGSRPVPLRVTLLYENEHPVLKQDILKMSPDCQRVIDSNGKAVLKLRIEDVSKNHQGQAFRLKVEPDTAQSPMHFDVAYDLSSTIAVRSKRNKRRPTKNPPAQITHHIIAGSSNPVSATSSPSSNAENEGPASALNSFTADERRKRMRTDGSPSGAMDSGNHSNANTLTGAMENVLSWTGAVVHGLHQLEWQTVGYESKTDGTADPERPIYRCPACWRYKDVMTYETAQHDTKCLIANLLLTYATDTMGHLDFVLKSIERFPSMLAAQAQAAKMAQVPITNMLAPTGQQGPTLISPQHMQGVAMDVNVDGVNANVASNSMMSAALLMSSSMNTPSTSQYSIASQPVSSSSVPPQLTRGLTDMMAGMDGPPGLFRGTSGGLTDFMRSLDDQDTTEPSFYQNLSTSQSTQVVNAVEMQVYYVLARMITLDNSNAIGFPAFDSSMNLLGFYQEGRESATTEVVFVPVSDIPGLSAVEISQTHRLLTTEVKENSSAVHTLSRCNNDLVKLKEDVILFHWNAKDRGSQQW